jgi:hypothetical protein
MPSDPWNQTAPREPGPRSNREHLHRRELARRNWPNLAMAGFMLVGFLAGLVVLNTVRPATELAANLLLGGWRDGSRVHPVGVRRPDGGPTDPIIVVWVLGLALVAALLVIF